jgi:hypothetical protein
VALLLSVTDHWIDGKKVHVTGTLTASGNYPAGGDVIPFNTFNNPSIKTDKAPIWAEAVGLGGGDYFVSLGTTLANSKLRVITSSTGLELAAGAYPVTVTGNPMNFYAIFPRM